MRGHDAIVAMRTKGRKPAIVFLNDHPCDTDWHQTGEHATVCVDGDQPELLDLRFVQGLTVSISASTRDRAERLMSACKQAGASTVAAGVNEPEGHGRFRSAWSAIWHGESVHA